jgi:hypothetical protein
MRAYLIIAALAAVTPAYATSLDDLQFDMEFQADQQWVAQQRAEMRAIEAENRAWQQRFEMQQQLDRLELQLHR